MNTVFRTLNAVAQVPVAFVGSMFFLSKEENQRIASEKTATVAIPIIPFMGSVHYSKEGLRRKVGLPGELLELGIQAVKKSAQVALSSQYPHLKNDIGLGIGAAESLVTHGIADPEALVLQAVSNLQDRLEAKSPSEVVAAALFPALNTLQEYTRAREELRGQTFVNREAAEKALADRLPHPALPTNGSDPNQALAFHVREQFFKLWKGYVTTGNIAAGIELPINGLLYGASWVAATEVEFLQYIQEFFLQIDRELYPAILDFQGDIERTLGREWGVSIAPSSLAARAQPVNHEVVFDQIGSTWVVIAPGAAAQTAGVRRGMTLNQAQLKDSTLVAIKRGETGKESYFVGITSFETFLARLLPLFLKEAIPARLTALFAPYVDRLCATRAGFRFYQLLQLFFAAFLGSARFVGSQLFAGAPSLEDWSKALASNIVALVNDHHLFKVLILRTFDSLVDLLTDPPAATATNPSSPARAAPEAILGHTLSILVQTVLSLVVPYSKELRKMPIVKMIGVANRAMGMIARSFASLSDNIVIAHTRHLFFQNLPSAIWKKYHPESFDAYSEILVGANRLFDRSVHQISQARGFVDALHKLTLSLAEELAEIGLMDSDLTEFQTPSASFEVWFHNTALRAVSEVASFYIEQSTVLDLALLRLKFKALKNGRQPNDIRKLHGVATRLKTYVDARRTEAGIPGFYAVPGFLIKGLAKDLQEVIDALDPTHPAFRFETVENAVARLDALLRKVQDANFITGEKKWLEAKRAQLVALRADAEAKKAPHETYLRSLVNNEKVRDRLESVKAAAAAKAAAEAAAKAATSGTPPTQKGWFQAARQAAGAVLPALKKGCEVAYQVGGVTYAAMENWEQGLQESMQPELAIRREIEQYLPELIASAATKRELDIAEQHAQNCQRLIDEAGRHLFKRKGVNPRSWVKGQRGETYNLAIGVVEVLAPSLRQQMRDLGPSEAPSSTVHRGRTARLRLDSEFSGAASYHSSSLSAAAAAAVVLSPQAALGTSGALLRRAP
jgi:hypothetical protein